MKLQGKRNILFFSNHRTESFSKMFFSFSFFPLMEKGKWNHKTSNTTIKYFLPQKNCHCATNENHKRPITKML